MTEPRKGCTLVHFIDLEQERQIRAWLKQPKRAHPGLTHALHRLFDAYVQLERRHLDLVNSVATAKDALK